MLLRNNQEESKKVQSLNFLCNVGMTHPRFTSQTSHVSWEGSFEIFIIGNMNKLMH